MTARDERVLAVIIGRAGSKGLPGKNALDVAGKPMIAHTIRDAQAAQHVDRVIVSTDGASIERSARDADVEVFHRPAHLADDQARVDDAVRHAVDACEDSASIIVVLYANVPVRPPGLLDRAVEMLLKTGADSVQSYTAVGKYHPWWMVRLDAEDARVVAYDDHRVYRRQDLAPLFLPDGGVIVVRRSSLERVIEGEPHAFLGVDRRGVTTAPGEVVDVDTHRDLLVADALLRARAAHVIA